MRDTFDEREEKARSCVQIKEYKEATTCIRILSDASDFLKSALDTELCACDQFRAVFFLSQVCRTSQVNECLILYYTWTVWFNDEARVTHTR